MRIDHTANFKHLCAAGALFALAIAAGCSGAKKAERPEPLTASDFASTAQASEAPQSDDVEAEEEPALLIERRASLIDPEVSQVRVIDAEEAMAGLDDVAVLTGPPPTIAPSRDGDVADGVIFDIADDAAPTPPTLRENVNDDMISSYPIDALVGHINGRPLFASEFFDPMDARMRVEAARMSQRQWLQFAQQQIQRALRDRIRDELLLAELEASLSPQEKVGLLAFVTQLRENILSENSGSAPLANRRLLEEEGVTLDEKVLLERNRELIRMQLRRAIAGKTIVAWRDVRQAYERDIDRYNPPPVAHLRVIWTQPGDEVTAVEIAERLESGEPFAEIAANPDLNSYQVADAGATIVPLDADGWEATQFFRPVELNNAALSLEVSEVVGPIDWANRKVWMTLELIEDNTVSLYDAQLEIYQDLLAERFTEAQGQYFTTLISRGSLSDIAEMERRLFELAAERYLINGRMP
jgi:hypothetical protein